MMRKLKIFAQPKEFKIPNDIPVEFNFVVSLAKTYSNDQAGFEENLNMGLEAAKSFKATATSQAVYEEKAAWVARNAISKMTRNNK